MVKPEYIIAETYRGCKRVIVDKTTYKDSASADSAKNAVQGNPNVKFRWK